MLREALEAAGFTLAAGEAGLFLWARGPEGDGDATPGGCSPRGVVVVPGRYFGPGGEAWVRVAPAPEEDACREAARRIASEGTRWKS